MIDITGFMNWFISEVAGILGFVFSVLNRISFGGTSLLDFSIACLIIGLFIDLFVISVKSRAVRGRSDKGGNKSKESSNSKKGSSNDD